MKFSQTTILLLLPPTPSFCPSPKSFSTCITGLAAQGLCKEVTAVSVASKLTQYARVLAILRMGKCWDSLLQWLIISVIHMPAAFRRGGQ